jgi:hypothetical protein
MDIYRIKKLTKEDVEYLSSWGYFGRVMDFVYAVLRAGLECPVDVENCDDDVCDDAFWIMWFDRQYYKMLNFNRFAAKMAMKILEYNKDVLDLYGFEYELLDISGWCETPKEIWDFVRLVKKGEYSTGGAK